MVRHMVARAACREGFVRFGALVTLLCVGGVTLPGAAAQPSDEPVRDADEAIARTRELVDPIERCTPADDGSLTVCGNAPKRHRLTPQQREHPHLRPQDAPPPPPPPAKSTEKLRERE